MAVARKSTRKRTVKRATKKRAPVKKAQKAAVLDAKTEAQRISQYLRALQLKKTKMGPKAKPEVLARRVSKARDAAAMRTGIRQLEAVQRLRNLERKQADPSMNGNFEKLETNFIETAKGFGERKGIDYGTWRAVGVDAAVLKKAGITRAG
jgi:hypothetical protein